MELDKVIQRKIKLLLSSKTDERKEFEQNHHCFIGVWNGYTEKVDYWLRVTNDNHVVSYEILHNRLMVFKLRARYTLGYTFAVWLPNELADKLKKPEDLDDIQDIIINGSFEI